MEGVLTSRCEDLKPALVVAPDAPVQHAGVNIDCAAKLASAVPGIPILRVAPWSSPDKGAWTRKTDAEAYAECHRACEPLPVESDHPLFVSYTSVGGVASSTPA